MGRSATPHRVLLCIAIMLALTTAVLPTAWAANEENLPAIVGNAEVLATHDAHFHDADCGHKRRYHDGRWNYFYNGFWEYYDGNRGIWYYYPRAIMLGRLAADVSKGTSILISLIGKDIRGQEIQRFLDEIEIAPEVSRYDDSYFYNFKAKGISLKFNKDDKLWAVFLYSEGVNGFRQFRGELPFGLSFHQTRREIEKILGKPKKSSQLPSRQVQKQDVEIQFWASYPEKGLGIDYTGKPEADMYDAKIYTIRLASPKSR